MGQRRCNRQIHLVVLQLIEVFCIQKHTRAKVPAKALFHCWLCVKLFLLFMGKSRPKVTLTVFVELLFRATRRAHALACHVPIDN